MFNGINAKGKPRQTNLESLSAWHNHDRTQTRSVTLVMCEMANYDCLSLWAWHMIIMMICIYITPPILLPCCLSRAINDLFMKMKTLHAYINREQLFIKTRGTLWMLWLFHMNPFCLITFKRWQAVNI